MSEITENTLTAYLGPEFQQKLMWQILVEPEFAEKIIPDLSVEYFDDPNYKRLFLIILEYIKEHEKVPNLQNQSIYQAINRFKTPNNVIEEESLFSVAERIRLWNERVLNKQLMHDGDVVQKATHTFVRQQEYRKLGEFILDKTKNGDIKQKHTLGLIDDKIQKIAHIGEEEDDGIDVTEGVERALRREFRQTIPTGVNVLDSLTGGGLGKGEIGLILTPSGVGKTTLLTKIANTAREHDYNVLQIVFEDTIEQIQRKHYTIWTGVALSEIDENCEFVADETNKKIKSLGNKGRLTIKRFSQEDTTMKDIRAWIIRYQKKHGFKFDIVVLDYLDCLESHRKTADRTEAELVVIKSFEAMASDFNIPCWTAIQTNRTGINAELVEAYQSGGSIKRLQKAHFFMSVAKTPEQKEAHLANIQIIKARFAQDGQIFKDCIFNNDTMKIVIHDERYATVKDYRKKFDTDEKQTKFAEKDTNLRMHTYISNAETEKNEDKNTDDLLKDYLKSTGRTDTENIVTKKTEGITEGANEGITNIHISTERTDLTETEIKAIVEFANEAIKETDDGLIEIDESPEAQKNIEVSEELQKSARLMAEQGDSLKKEPLLDWSGETLTHDESHDVEVTISDVPSVIYIPADNRIYAINKAVESPPIIPNEKSKVDLTQSIEEKNKNIFDIEKTFVDDDNAGHKQKHVFDILNNMSKNQNVVKKE